MKWPNFSHPHVRDLAWSLLSPPLLNLSQHAPSQLNIDDTYITKQYSLPQPYDELIAWLEDLDCNQQALLDYLSKRHSTRLGLYFEALWQFYLQSTQQLFGHNIQINDQGKTLGEIDFLLKPEISNPDSIIHAEAAVKFYLGHPPTQQKFEDNECNWSAWIGPNAKDRLSRKMQHLIEHQLRVSQHKAAHNPIRETLAEAESKGIYSPTDRLLSISPQLILRGRFFYPYHENMPAPTGAHKQHLKGFWCYQHQLQDFIKWCDKRSEAESFSSSNVTSGLEATCAEVKNAVINEGLERGDDCSQPHYKWLILNRQQWFAEVEFPLTDNKQTKGLINEAALRNELKDKSNMPIVIAQLESRDNHWQEVLRSFVMPDHWPN